MVEAVIDGRAAASLAGWLADRVPALTAPIRSSLLTGGRSNLTYLVTDAGGRQWVLRRPPLTGVLESAHNVIREHRVMAALRDTAVPVPRMVASCEDVSVLGAPFFVMEFVAGTVLIDQRAAETALTLEARSAFARSIVDVLSRLHAVSPAAVGLADLGRGGDYIVRQLRRWEAQLEQMDVEQSPQMHNVLARLRASPPTQRRTTIVHGDFRPGNMVVGVDGRVRALLDWELCTLGDPLADLGWLLAYWGSAGDAAVDLPLPVPTRAAGFPPAEDVLAQYVETTGQPADDVEFYVSFALWRLAAIWAGVQARVRRGAYGRSGVPDEQADERLRRLVAAAATMADRAGR